MKRKMILTSRILVVGCFLHLFGSAGMLDGELHTHDISYAYAQNQDVKYEYDSLGRISTVRYPDGTEIEYVYDANGNLLYIKKSKKQTLPDDSSQSGGSTQESGGSQSGGSTQESGGSQSGGSTQESGGSQSGGSTQESGGSQSGGSTQESGGSQSGGSTQESGSQSGGSAQQSGGSTGNANSGSEQMQKLPAVSNPQHYTATDLKNYNQFKNKKPVIKSLKNSKSKKKYYLTIKIKQVKKRGIYGETGYQIKYAANKNFKKAKTIKITRSKKSSITSKKWKVKKGKTYYIKVRAIMKTRTGKTIYSKYSKVKSIKIK